jgi:transcription antitermination factor NusG
MGNACGKRMNWYVLRSKPNREEALWNEVCVRGFEVFYPYLRVKPVNPRSRTTRPYFPGYLFVHTALADVGQSVFNWLPYSYGLVSFDGQPAEVPDALVQAIRKRVDQVQAAGGEQLFEIERGETVLIQGGPFAGYKAIFDARLAGEERVRVLLKLLQVQQVKLDLPAGMIQRTKRL